MRRLEMAGIVVVVAFMLGGVLINFMPATSNLANTVASVRSGVVHIQKVGEWQGSGFIITSDGIIVTAKHVVEGGGTFIVTLDDGTKYTTSTAVAYKDYDIGFLKIKTEKPLPVVELTDIKSLNVGDSIFIIGSPLGFDNFNSVTLGIISAKQRNLDAVTNSGYGWTVTFQSDAAAYPGNSGGPVFNMRGQVVGVLVAGQDANLNYSVPVVVFINDVDLLKLVIESVKFKVLEPPILELPQVDYMSMIMELQAKIEDLQKQIDTLKSGSCLR